MATRKWKIQTEEVKKTENRKRQKWNDRKKGKKVLCCGTEELRVFGEENCASAHDRKSAVYNIFAAKLCFISALDPQKYTGLPK